MEYVRGIPVVKVFQQTVYSFNAFYTAILERLGQPVCHELPQGPDRVSPCINGGFALLIPAALLLAGGDGWAVLADFIFYALVRPPPAAA